VYESINEPLLSRRLFVRRMVRHGAAAIALLGGSLLLGVIGYWWLDDLPPVDAFLNAAMILGGMGPVDPLTNDAAKLFAGVYALYAGVVFLVSVGVIFAPALHRVLHKLHLGDDKSGPSGTGES
jgi:hypothetical protein